VPELVATPDSKSVISGGLLGSGGRGPRGVDVGDMAREIELMAGERGLLADIADLGEPMMEPDEGNAADFEGGDGRARIFDDLDGVLADTIEEFPSPE